MAEGQSPEGQRRVGGLAGLYTGTGAFDIIGKRVRAYVVFGVLVLVCLGSIVFRGFNLSIDFVGGSRIQFPATGLSAEASNQRVGQVVAGVIGKPPESVQRVGKGPAESVLIRVDSLNRDDTVKLKQALFDAFHPRGQNGQPSVNAISDSAVSSSWGGEITSQALIALAVFMVLVTLFLAFYFERAMAIAAVVALAHDLIVTAGVYSLVGFEVSPSTIIGLLTILGFSLYDTVVVFDKVKENSRGILGLTRRTYAEAANLALNQTLMRSINTSLIAVLPVLGLLIVGVGVLGVGTLADLALVQMVGLLSGALSSIFLATPILVDLKMRDRRYQQQAARVAARRAKLAGKRSVNAAGDEVDVSDDDELAAELRRERAVAAAAGVPARAATSRRSASSSTGQGQPGQGQSRPSGKRRR
ncbi:MAG: protein translocase subunit SecF [Pseudonocardia sp.]|nr:protein translocase subunit SecF [Pseudonocardia sp.]